MDTISIFNRLQQRFGRALELISLDELAVEFRCPHWAGRQFAVVLHGGDFRVTETVGRVDETNAKSEWIADLINDYSRTNAGNMVPRERVAEFNAAGK